mgnify:CR=1 FL=1
MSLAGIIEASSIIRSLILSNLGLALGLNWGLSGLKSSRAKSNLSPNVDWIVSTFL